MNKEKKMKRNNKIYNQIVKRFLDILLSIVLLILLSPVYIILIVILYVFQGKPIIFRQTRLGLNRQKIQNLQI